MRRANIQERSTSSVTLLQSVLGFAVVSGTGLALDFGIFIMLTHGWGTAPAIANGIGGACAVTFVFFGSVRRIFDYSGGFLIGQFLIYLCYQVLGVTAASLAVGWLVRHGLVPWLAKVAVLPVTFSCNYLFMRVLTSVSIVSPVSRK